MREIDARVTGFDYTTFHAYTTEVEVDGRMWTLGIRYNTFFQFYTRLTALEKHFKVDFPPKGGLFFSPPPEERQEQLDDFLLSTLAYFDMRGHPRRMEALLGELLQIPENLDIKDDDERTASEGSSVAEELLLDTPMPGHDDAADDFLDSGTEDDVHEDKDVAGHQEVHVEDEHHDVEVAELETKPAVQQQEEEEKQDAVEVEAEDNQQVTEAMPSPKSEIKAQPLEEGTELKGGAVAKNYIAMLRRKTLVNGAIQAAVVSTMKENVEKAKAAKMEKDVDNRKSVQEIKKEEPIAKEEVATPELEAKPETPVVDEESVLPVESTPKAEVTASAVPPTDAISEAPVAVLEVSEVVTTVPEEEAVEPMVASAPTESPIEPHLEEAPVTEQDAVAEDSAPASALEAESEPAAATALESVQEEASSTSEEESEEEAVPEPSKEEPESENPVVSWFRRMGSTFGPSAAEKEALEEQEAAAAAKKKQEEEEKEKEAAAQAEAATKAAAETAKAEAEAAAKAEAEEAELLRAEQELNLRLKPYRHPVFFQGFNCDVGTSRYSLPARLSDGIVV